MTDYPGRHRRIKAGKHMRGYHPKETSAATCPYEMRADLWETGDTLGRLLRPCTKEVCPRHKPILYSMYAAPTRLDPTSGAKHVKAGW